MSFEQQLDQPPTELSLADRRRKAQDLLRAGPDSVMVTKKSKAVAKKDEAIEISVAWKDRAENYENLVTEGSYDELKDIDFDVFFRSLASNLNKNEEDYLNFVQNKEDIEGLKKELADFDNLSDEHKSKEVREEFESLRAFATKIMRQWAKTLSEWFAEQAAFYQEEASEADKEIEALANEPLFTAEFRTADETFDSSSYRAMLEFSDKLAEKARLSMLHSVRVMEMGSKNSELKTDTREILNHLNIDYSETVQFFTMIKQVVALGAWPNTDELNSLYPNFSFYLPHKDSERKKMVLQDFKKLVVKAEAVERAVEAQRYFAEQQMRAVIKIITDTFNTDEQRQDALLFVKLADHEAHAKPQMHSLSPFSNDFRVGDYGGNPPPDWLIEVYKKLNSAHLFGALLKKELEDVRSRVNEDQILRAISKQPAYGNPETDESLYATITFDRYGEPGNIVVPKRDIEVKAAHPIDDEAFTKFSRATLDPELIAMVESVWKDLDENGAQSKIKFTGICRSFLSKCSIQGITYETAPVGEGQYGFQMVPHITSSSLNKKVQSFRNTVDVRLVGAQPAVLERLTQRAKKDGVIQIGSVADGVEVIGAMQGLVEKYLLHDRPQLEESLSKAGEEVARAKEREDATLRELQVRINQAVIPHQEVAEKNRVSAESLAEQLFHAQNEYVEMKKRLEGQVRDLTARNLTYSTEVSSLNTQLSAEKAKSDTARVDLLKDIRSALHEAATMDAGFMGGDGTRYKKLKELLTSLG
jgi:hypothetical protein